MGVEINPQKKSQSEKLLQCLQYRFVGSTIDCLSPLLAHDEPRQAEPLEVMGDGGEREIEFVGHARDGVLVARVGRAAPRRTALTQ